MSSVLITLGLFLDVIGVFVLWKYGLPSKVVEVHPLAFADLDEEDKKNNSNVVKISRIGLSLLVAGFILQLIGNWI